MLHNGCITASRADKRGAEWVWLSHPEGFLFGIPARRKKEARGG